MIHVAAGLLILSLTTLAVGVVSWVVPGTPALGHLFVPGAVLATATSSVLLFAVREGRL
jgi:hypothetical protein